MVRDVRGPRVAIHSVPKLGLSGEILRVVWTVPKLTVDCMCCLCVDMLLLCLNNMLLCVNFVNICLLDILTCIV